jgi:ferrous iron transport protein A
LHDKFSALKQRDPQKLSHFPKNKMGIIKGYDNEHFDMPNKILEMGLLPETSFRILYQAPFKGPIYIEFGEEKSRIALREEEGDFIIVEESI